MSSPPRPPHLRRVPDAPTLPSHTPRRPPAVDRRQSPNTSLASIGSASSQLPPLSGIGLTPWARRSDPARLITTPGLMAMGGLIASPSFTPDMQISASAPGFGPSPIRSPSVRPASASSGSHSHSSPPSAPGILLRPDDERRPRAPSRAGSDSALLPTPHAHESALPTPREMAAEMPDSPRADTSHRLPGLGHLLKPSQPAPTGTATATAAPKAQTQAQAQSENQSRPQFAPYAPRPLRRGPDDSQCTDADADAEGDADMSGEHGDRSADQSQADLVGLGVVLDAHQRRHRQPPRASSPLHRTLPAAPKLGSSDQGRFSNVLDLYPDDERVLLPRSAPHSATPQVLPQLQPQSQHQPQAQAQAQAQTQTQTQTQPQLMTQPQQHPHPHPHHPVQQAQGPSWGPSPKRIDPSVYPRAAGLSGLGLTFEEHDLSWRPVPVDQEWARWSQGEMTPHLFGDLPLDAAGVGMMPIPVDRMHLQPNPNPSPMSGHLPLPSPTGTMLDSPAVGWSPLPDEKGAGLGVGAASLGSGPAAGAGLGIGFGPASEFAAAKQAVPAPPVSKRPAPGSYRVQSKARSAALVCSTAAAFEAHAAFGAASAKKRKQPLAEEEQSPWGVFSLNPKKSGWKPLFPPGIRPPVHAQALQQAGTGARAGTSQPALAGSRPSTPAAAPAASSPPKKARATGSTTGKLAVKPKPALALKVNRV